MRSDDSYIRQDCNKQRAPPQVERPGPHLAGATTAGTELANIEVAVCMEGPEQDPGEHPCPAFQKPRAPSDGRVIYSSNHPASRSHPALVRAAHACTRRGAGSEVASWRGVGPSYWGGTRYGHFGILSTTLKRGGVLTSISVGGSMRWWPYRTRLQLRPRMASQSRA